ncbi:transglutaminase domain-containing protein [Paenibacillus sp. PL91]|uniref:transglutaminase domain-containing protein n=1 Tax=Paenibacillus sp. PL91 TaxID=2729538 RepID=UPI00145CE6E8|nr:transglutaminase domain-containing protein [Paenibacillus sp. PL91]MBC9200474.1 transglutaminase [Paenibacillus sp. PL91]
MHRVASKLLVVVFIIIAAFYLDFKLDLFPAAAESEEVAVVDESNKLESLEQQIAKQFQARAEHFSVTYTGDKQELSGKLTDVIRAALSHDDYSAYILESYIYTIRSWGNKSTIALEARYRETPAQTAVVDREVAKALQEIIEPGMNDHEKIKAIHDWIVSHVEYDQTLKHYTAYDAIKLGETVCQGYSLLGYKMLKEAGITVLIAEGTVNTGEHAWNMVQLDGVWYHLDLTWDDPVGVSASGNNASSDASKPNKSTIRYNYYLKTDAELRADHQWTKTYPVATAAYADTIRELEKQGNSAERNRFSKLKLELGLHWLEPEFTVSSSEQLNQVIQSALDSRTASLEFRYEDADQFPAALKAAFESVKVAVGYRASYEPYAGNDSLIVRIQLEYAR